MIQVPAGFSLELFVSEPDIINPIAMDWDEKGRLWVIETVDYPNTVREDDGIGDDRIKICEDSNGDGRADKFTIFADNLNIPTSMTFVNGGVMVSQAPYFVFLKDTDGDDKADIRENIMEGWGTFDTHAGPSNLKYGMDNQIWGVVGYSGFEGTVAGSDWDFYQGIYRFKPDLSSFEWLTHTSNNTWGLGFTEDNEVFASTANNTHSVHMSIPNKYLDGTRGVRSIGNSKIDGHYDMHAITDKVRQVDVFGGFTAASGHNFYTARQYPEEYWNKVAFVCEPTGHLVHSAKIEKDGAGYKEQDGWNLFASADEWVSPVEAKVGPDGVVWVLDWYNFIVQHNPTPRPDFGGYEAENGDGNAYINPLRDKSHGRIWRIVYKGNPVEKIMPLDRSNTEKLVSALSNDNMFWRMTAQRILVENGGKEAVPALIKNINKSDVSALHALWTLSGLGLINYQNPDVTKSVMAALESPNPAVRKAAIQVLPSEDWAINAIIEAGLLKDENLQTRMKAILSLADASPSDATGKLVYGLTNDVQVQEDPWLSRAVYAAAVKQRQGFMASYLADNPDFEDRMKNKKAEQTFFDFDLNDRGWETMNLPGTIEDGGEDIDGVIWFRKTINMTSEFFDKDGAVWLGLIDDSDETWLNGVRIGGLDDSRDIRRYYRFGEEILRPGKNVIAVKLTDKGGSGGFGTDGIYLGTPKGRISLEGEWKYLVTDIRKSAKGGSYLADNFMENYWNFVPEVEKPKNEIVGREINISVIQNAMKYDVESIEVTAGETVTIVFKNPDFMQHNLLITKPGSLAVVGMAADAMASRSDAAERNYVPDVPEVLFSTKLIDPNKQEVLTFTVPDTPGEYPFICTFPGHWRTMNGIMIVKSSAL